MVSSQALQGDFWVEFLLHDIFIMHASHFLPQTYLFISRKRIVGCLVLEPITTAHRIISKSSSSDSSRSTKLVPESSNANSRKTAKSVLQFGNVTFRRESIKSSSRTAEQNMWDSGGTSYEEEAVPAVCGVRVIWVAPSQRRKRVAKRLLDAARYYLSFLLFIVVSNLMFN